MYRLPCLTCITRAICIPRILTLKCSWRYMTKERSKNINSVSEIALHELVRELNCQIISNYRKEIMDCRIITFKSEFENIMQTLYDDITELFPNHYVENVDTNYLGYIKQILYYNGAPK